MSAWKKQDYAPAIFSSVSEDTEEIILQFMCSGKADDPSWDFGKFKAHYNLHCVESSQVVRDRTRQVKKMRTEEPKKYVEHCLYFGLCPPLAVSSSLTNGHNKNNADNFKLQLHSGTWMLQHTLDCNPSDGDWSVTFGDDFKSVWISYAKQAPEVSDRLKMFTEGHLKTDDFLFKAVQEATMKQQMNLKREHLIEEYAMFMFDKEMVGFFVDRNGERSADAFVRKDVDKDGRARLTMFMREKQAWIQQLTSPQAFGSPKYNHVPNNVAFQFGNEASVDHDMANTDTSATASWGSTEPGTLGINPQKPPVATRSTSDKIAQLTQDLANLTKLVTESHMRNLN